MKVSVFSQGMMERLHRNCCRIELIQAALGLSIQMEKTSSITYRSCPACYPYAPCNSLQNWSVRLIVSKEYACIMGQNTSIFIDRIEIIVGSIML